MYIGRINPIKNIDKLLIALRKSNLFLSSDYKLTIAGKGVKKYVDYINQIISENGLCDKVYFPNKIIDGEEKGSLYAKSKYLFLISETENFGNVVLEGMSYGVVPVTSLGTPWSILSEQNVGFYLSNDVDSLSRLIDKLIEMDDKSYNKISNNAQLFVEKKFNTKDITKKYINFYHSL